LIDLKSYNSGLKRAIEIALDNIVNLDDQFSKSCNLTCKEIAKAIEEEIKGVL